MTEIETHRFPCETCGSDLRFEPGSERLICDHCGASEAIVSQGQWRSQSLRELDFRAAIADELPEAEIEETRILDCPNCGAQVAFSPEDHAAECPFCATPVVTDTGTHRHIKPRGVLPFALKEAEARAAMGRWLGQLWFAPGGLQAFARRGRKMQGIYVPYWTYDADTKSRYTGDRGTIHYETKTVQVTIDGKSETREQQVATIHWRRVSGRVARFFDDVLVLGSKSLPKDYTDALGPWDLSALEPYQPEFLAGFRAEGYTISLEEGYQEASAIMERTILRDVKFDIGGDRQRVHKLETDVGQVTFKHVLLPIWLAAYKYRGKSYRFVVNGRTGTVRGERPWSWIKIGFAIVAGLILAGIVGYLIALNQGDVAAPGWQAFD